MGTSQQGKSIEMFKLGTTNVQQVNSSNFQKINLKQLKKIHQNKHCAISVNSV